MDRVMDTAAFWLAAVALPLVVIEVSELFPWLAVRVVRFAASRLGTQADRDRYAEEFTANLTRVPGRIVKLAVALGILAATPVLRWVLHTPPPAVGAGSVADAVTTPATSDPPPLPPGAPR